MLSISYQMLGYIVNTPWLMSKCSLAIWIQEVPHIFMLDVLVSTRFSQFVMVGVLVEFVPGFNLGYLHMLESFEPESKWNNQMQLF